MKYSFKISWIDQEQKFIVKLLGDGEVLEEHKFDGSHDVFDYIEDTASGLMIMGEDWTMSY